MRCSFVTPWLKCLFFAVCSVSSTAALVVVGCTNVNMRTNWRSWAWWCLKMGQIYRMLAKFTEMHRNAPRFTEFCRKLPKFTEFCRNLPKFMEINRINQNLPKLNKNFRNLPKYTRKGLVLPGSSFWVIVLEEERVMELAKADKLNFGFPGLLI